MAGPRRPTPPGEKFKLVLRPSGPQPVGSGDDLVSLIRQAQRGAPKLPKAQFRPAEFPGEVVEQVIEGAKRIEAETEAVEVQLQQTPPPPDQRADMIRDAAAEVIAAVRDLLPHGIRVRARTEPVPAAVGR